MGEKLQSLSLNKNLINQEKKMKNIRELATIFEKMMEQRERTSTQEKFWAIKENQDPELTERLSDVIKAAHDNCEMLPDDHRYRFVWECLVAISEREDIEDAEQNATEPDIYYYDLTSWLASRNDRLDYLTRALEEFGPITDGVQALQLAQYIEKSEVFQAVVSALEQIEIEDEEEKTL